MNIFADYAPLMLDLGYSPVPLKTDRNPLIKGWQHLRDRALPRAEIADLGAKYHWLGIGAAGGFNGLVPVDFDTDDADIMAAVGTVLPRPNMGKRGSKGFTGFYRSTSPIKGCKLMPPAPECKPLIEILTTGNTTIPPTRHPKINKPYRWLTAKTMFNTPVSELVEITPDHIEGLREVMQPWCPRKEYTAIQTVDRELVNDNRMRAYATAVIRSQAEALSGILSGRNHALFRAACMLGKYVHNGIVGEDAVRDALMAASRLNAYVASDGEHTAQGTITSGIAQARNDRLPDLDSPQSRSFRSRVG